MNFNEKLLEAIVEAIRFKRRRGPQFPTVFDLSHIKYDAENNRIELKLLVDNKEREFHLNLIEVKEQVGSGNDKCWNW